MKTEQQFHTFTNNLLQMVPCRGKKKKNTILSVNAELHIVPAISLLTLCLKDNNMVSEKEKVPFSGSVDSILWSNSGEVSET